MQTDMFIYSFDAFFGNKTLYDIFSIKYCFFMEEDHVYRLDEIWESHVMDIT